MAFDYEKLCFVIMPFGEPGTEEATKWDRRFNNLIKRAVNDAELGLLCRREDSVNRPGSIPEDICQNLEHARFVIADLSGKNQNVAYELGLRHARKHGTILIAESGTELPFDFNKERTIFFSDDDAGEEKAIRKIIAYLKEVHADPAHKDSPHLRAVGEVSATAAVNAQFVPPMITPVPNRQKSVGSSEANESDTAGNVASIDSEKFCERVEALLFQMDILPDTLVEQYHHYYVHRVLRFVPFNTEGRDVGALDRYAHFYVVLGRHVPYELDSAFYIEFCELFKWCTRENVFSIAAKVTFIVPFNGAVGTASDVVGNLIHHSKKYLSISTHCDPLLPDARMACVSRGSLTFEMWDIPRLELLEKELKLA